MACERHLDRRTERFQRFGAMLPPRFWRRQRGASSGVRAARAIIEEFTSAESADGGSATSPIRGAGGARRSAARRLYLTPRPAEAPDLLFRETQHLL